jgi:RNA polymerase sigma-70 factor (ECF subfamily)
LADDLAQEVFIRAWKARDRYQELGNARAYLLRIADHLVCDYFRKLGREVNLSDQQWEGVEPARPRSEPEAAEAVMRKEACAKLGEALELLTAAQRRVLLLRYFGDLSFAEIAGVMECPLGTALSHARRGLQALRELFVQSES